MCIVMLYHRCGEAAPGDDDADLYNCGYRVILAANHDGACAPLSRLAPFSSGSQLLCAVYINSGFTVATAYSSSNNSFSAP